MQIQLPQLPNTFKQKLAPVYLVSGDVPLLIQEARDTLYLTAKTLGFNEREILIFSNHFDWNYFYNASHSFSLFSNKSIIELHNPDAKFDDTGLKALTDYLNNPPADKLLVIITDKLTSAQQKTRWYKAIDAAGYCIAVRAPFSRELPQWVQQRLQQKKLNASREAVTLLAEYGEGNLLAIQQAITKLQLLYPQESIDANKMMSAICDSARFNVFDLTNSLLAGNAKQTLRILHNLRDEGMEPPLVLWALSREARDLFNKSHQLQQGMALSQIIANEWQARKPLLQAALQRLTLQHLEQLLQYASEIDLMIKGVKSGNIWDMFTEFALTFCAAKGVLKAKI